MTELILPNDTPRVKPLYSNQVNAYVRSEYDKSIHTWGIPNNLIRTLAVLPRLGLTEIDYANSFIFDKEDYSLWPDPSNENRQVLFPLSGFIDRVTKELLISLVSLLNKSRYSITHHAVIGFNTISSVHGANRAESMMLHLIDEDGNIDYEHRNDLYDDFQIEAMKLSVKLRGDVHEISDDDFSLFRELCQQKAKDQITASPVLSTQEASNSSEFVSAYVDGMIVELTWLVLHFSGLLNKWFTVLKVMDETDEHRDGIDFISVYNTTVPESIKKRNNALLSPDGWGGIL